MLVRTHARDNGSFRALVGADAMPVPGEVLSDIVENWCSYVKPEFLGRNVMVVKNRDINDENLSMAANKETERKILSACTGLDGKMFIKTRFKKTSAVVNLNDTMPVLWQLLGYGAEYAPPDTEFIASEVMDISKDSRGQTKEYRCYVVRGKAVSFSRYVDSRDRLVPRKVKDFFHSFVDAHMERFGSKATYVVDACECTDGRVRMIEMNPLEGSGRYEGNRADALLVAFSSD